jgi:hypothetical protein
VTICLGSVARLLRSGLEKQSLPFQRMLMR